MIAQAAPLAITSSTSREDDELAHFPCCHDPDLAMCGADLTDSPDATDDDLDCIVCDELDAAEPEWAECTCRCCVPEGSSS